MILILTATTKCRLRTEPRQLFDLRCTNFFHVKPPIFARAVILIGTACCSIRIARTRERIK